MSEQFNLFEAGVVAAPTADSRARLDFRPANMRTVHGIRDDDEFRRSGDHSVSCVRCAEDRLIDGQFVRESGGGMDAPEDLPLGSVKALLDERRLIGVCQRTYKRAA
jgi:hypothetical protein